MQPFRRPLQRPSTSTPRDDHDDASATHDANTNHASKTLTVDTGTLSPLCSSTEEASTPAPMSSAVSSLRSPREGTLPYDGSGSPSRASINTPITNRTNANTTIHSSSCNSVHEEEQPPQRSSGNDSSEEGGVRMSARERVVKVSEEVVRLASPPPQGKGAKKKKGQAPSSSASSSRSSSSARPVANKSKTTPPRTTSPRGARAPTTKTSKSITPILSSRPNSASPVDVADVQALITNGLSGQRPPRGRRPPLHASASNNSDQKEPAAVSSPTRCEVENDVGAWMESSTDATRDRQSLEALREQLASGLRLSSSSSSSGSVRGRRAAVPHYAVATNEAAVGRLRAVDVLASSTTNSAAASITTAPPQRDAAADATHNNSDEHHDDGIRSSSPPSLAASDHNAVSAPSMMEAPTPPQQPPLVPADVRLANDVDGQGPLGRQTTPPFGTSADRLGISMSSSGTELLASEHILPHSGSDILASFNTLHSTVHPPDDAVVVVPSTATFATSSPPRMDELDGSVGGRRHHPPPMDSQRKTSNHHQHDDPYARAVQQHLDENDQQRFRPKGSCDSELVSATLRPQSVLEMDGGAATTSSRPTSSLVPTTSTITPHGSNKTSSSSSPKATAKTATSSPDVVVNAQSGTPHQHGSSSSFHDDDASNTMAGREKKHDRSSLSAMDAASSSTPSPPLLPNDAVHAEDVDASTHQQPPTHRGLQAALLANRDPHLRTQRQELSPHGDDVVGAAPIHIRDNNSNKEDEENMLVVYPHSNKVGLHHRNTSKPTQFRSASVDVAKASSARRHHMDAAQTTSPHDAHNPRASSAPSSPLRRRNTPTPLAESRYSGIAESPSLNSIELTTQKRNTATNVSHNNHHNNNTHVHERPGSKTRVYGARLPAYKGPSASSRSQKDPSSTETTPPTSAKDARRDVVHADAAPRLDGGSSASQHQDGVQEKKHPARSPSTMANTPLAPSTSTKKKTMKNANKMDDHHRGDGTPRAASLPVRGRTKPLSAKAKKTRKGVDDDAATPTPHEAPSPSRRASTQPPPSCQLIDLYTNDDGWINPHHLLHRPPNSAEMSAIWKNHPGSDSVREFVSTSARDVLVDVPIPEATEQDDAPAPADTSSHRREASSSDASIVGVEVVGDVQHHDAVDAPRAGSSPRPNKTPKKQPSSASRSSDVAQPTCASPTKSSQPTTPRTSKPKSVEDPTHQRRRRRRNPPPHDGTPTTTTSPSKPTVTAADEPPPNNNNNNNDGAGDEDEVWIDPTTLVHAPPSTHHRPPQWEHYIISASRQQHTTKEEEDINTPMSSRRRPTTRDAETKRAGKQKKTKKPTSPRSRSSTQRTNPLATPSSTSAPTSAGSTSSPRRPTKSADAASPRSVTQPPHPERPRRSSSSSARQAMLPSQPLEEVRPPSISTVASWEHTASPPDDLPPPSPGAPSSSSTPTSQSKAAKGANDVIAEDVKPGHAHRRHRTRKHAHRAPSTSSSVSDHAVMADVGSRRSKRSQHVEDKLTEAPTPDEHLRLTATTASPSSSSSSPRHMHHRRRRHRSKASQTTTKRQSSASSLPASRSRASSSSSSDDDDDHHPVSSQKKRLMERSNHNPLLAFVRSYVEMDPVAEIRSARHKSHRQPHRRGDEEEENDHAQHNATQLEPKPAGKKHRRRRRRVPSSPSSVDVDDDPTTPRRMSRTCSPPHATSFSSSATPRSRSATASPPSAPRVNDDHHHRRRRRTQRPHSSRSRRDASLQWSAHSSKSNISRSTISSRSSSPSPSCHDASTQWSAPVSSSSSDHVHNEAPRKVVGPRIKMHAKKLQWTTSPSKQSRRAHMHNPSTQHAARRSSPRGEVGNEEIDHPQHHPTQPTKKKRIKKRRAKDASASPRSREEATQYSARVSPHTFDRSSSRGDEYNAWSARTSPLSSNSSHSPLRRARERRRYHDGRRSARTSPKEHLLIHHHHQQQKQRRRISSSRAGSSSSSSSDASQRGPYFVYHSRAQLRRVGGASRNGRGGGRYHRPHPRQVVANTQNVWARLSASSHAPTIRRRVAHATLRPFYTGALAVPPSTKMAVVHDEVRSPRKSPLPGCVVGGRRRGDVGVGAASPRGRVHHQVVKRKGGAAEDRHHGAAPLVKDEGSATSSPRPLLRISKRSLAMYRPYFHAPPMPAAMRLQHPSRPLRRQSKRRGAASRRMRVPAAPTSSSPHKMAHKSRAKMRMEEEVDPYEHLLRRHGFWGETNSAMLVL